MKNFYRYLLSGTGLVFCMILLLPSCISNTSAKKLDVKTDNTISLRPPDFDSIFHVFFPENRSNEPAKTEMEICVAPGTMEYFTYGKWVSAIAHNNTVDTYEIKFFLDGSCSIKISSNIAEQETTGHWSFDGTLFKINAAFRNANLAHQTYINWVSVVRFDEDYARTFHILGPATNNGPTIRFSFIRQIN